MKKTILALFAISLIACNKDEEKNETNTVSIVGKWQEQKTVIFSGKDKTTVLSERIATDCDKKGHIEFKETVFNTVNYAINGMDQCVQDGGQENIPYVYDAPAKKITLNGETTDVIKLTATEFEVVTETSDKNKDGIVDNWVTYYKKI